MTLERLDPIRDPRWMDLLERAPSATAFNHPAWLSLLAERYGYGIHALAVQEQGRLVAGLPLARVESRLTGRRLVALPFSDLCPPALAGDGGALPELCGGLEEERLQSGLRVEVRWPLPGLRGAHVVPRFLHHRLRLGDDLDAYERGLRSAVRRNLKKARRSGVTVSAGTDRGALATFYALHLRTRRRQGVPTQPKGFILGIEQLLARGLGYVLVAHHGGRPVAAAVFLTFGDTMIYKYGASDERALDVRPNNLLFLEAIRRGIEQRVDWLDFGRTDFGHEGLRSFKRGWGAEEEELAYTYLGEEPPADGEGRATQLLGAVIRRSPEWVGRGVGAALYRHVG